MRGFFLVYLAYLKLDIKAEAIYGTKLGGQPYS